MRKTQKGSRIDGILIRKDFERLLAIVTDATTEPDYREIEEIAKQNGYDFDGEGSVVKA